MAQSTIPQPDETTVWSVTEAILVALRDDAIFNPKYIDNSLHLDWWWEQPFFEGDEYALPPLCIYVEANVVESFTETDKRQRVKVNFTVYMEWRSNADSHVGALTKNSFLSFKPYAMAIHRALQGFKNQQMYTALKRVAGPLNVPGIERKGVLISQTYQCIMYDCTASPEKALAQLIDFKLKGEVAE